MDRLFVWLGLAALLALATLHTQGEAQSAFFSLLFPQLVLGEGLPEWLEGWGEDAFEAVML